MATNKRGIEQYFSVLPGSKKTKPDQIGAKVRRTPTLRVPVHGVDLTDHAARPDGSCRRAAATRSGNRTPPRSPMRPQRRQQTPRAPQLATPLAR
jgi:hypothetical protein